ncbi:MAG: hypothetical protein REI94_02645 [Moraxellaceae bacterium]|nr:hypothetical protein [Moraxellaceae bacterium]
MPTRLLPLSVLLVLALPAAATDVPAAGQPGYRAFRDEAPRNWREVNDEVARAGGWRAYLREAQRENAPAAPKKDAKP